MGKKGQAGGVARASSLTAAERTAIARKAAQARWETKPKNAESAWVCTTIELLQRLLAKTIKGCDAMEDAFDEKMKSNRKMDSRKITYQNAVNSISFKLGGIADDVKRLDRDWKAAIPQVDE